MTSSQSETSSSKKIAKRSSYQRQKVEDNSPTQYEFFSESGTTYRPFTDPKRIANNDAKKAASGDSRKCVKGVPDQYLGVMNTALNECSSSASLDHALPVAPKEHTSDDYDVQVQSQSEQSGTAEALPVVQIEHHSPSDITETVINDAQSSYLSLPWHLAIPGACFADANRHDHHVYASDYATIGPVYSPVHPCPLEAPHEQQGWTHGISPDDCLDVSSRYSFNPDVQSFTCHTSGYDSPVGSSESSSSPESPSTSGSSFALTPFGPQFHETASVSFTTNTDGSILTKNDHQFLTGPDNAIPQYCNSFPQISSGATDVDDPILDIMNLRFNLQQNDLLCLDVPYVDGLVGLEDSGEMFAPDHKGFIPS